MDPIRALDDHVDLGTGQVLGIVDGRDHKGVGDWLFARPLAWRLGVQVAIDPSAAFRKALRMWLPRTAVSVDLFRMTMLTNDMLTTVRQGLSQQVRGRRGRATDPAWANRMLLLKADENLSERGQQRLAGVFSADDPTGSLEAAWQVPLSPALVLVIMTTALRRAAIQIGLTAARLRLRRYEAPHPPFRQRYVALQLLVGRTFSNSCL